MSSPRRVSWPPSPSAGLSRSTRSSVVALAGSCRARCSKPRATAAELKLIASVRSQAEALEIRVEPVALPLAEPLSRVEGVMNALTIETDTVREITIIGPGAGPEQAGQGLFADLVAVLRAPRLLG